MFASLWDSLIVQPIFNLLVFIYALIPGHNFGLAIILFTILVRLLMWPLIKKQLHHTKAMRAMQPEIKRIKAATKGNRQKEQLMMMELYKERGVSPFGMIGVMVVQIALLLALYSGLNRVVQNPQAIVDNAYGFLRNFGWMKELAADISKFDASLFGLIDLTRPAVGQKGLYLPAMALVVGSVVAQFYQSKQLLPEAKDSRGLRRILKDAGEGKQADQSEVQAAVGRSTIYLLPGMIFVFTVGLASALSLYWLVGGVIAYIQQGKILNQDEAEMEVLADAPSKKADKKPGDGTRIIIDGEVVKDTTSNPLQTSAKIKTPTKSVKAKPVKRRKK